MKLSEELEWRGFVNQTTFDKLDLLDNKIWTFYHGFDASADSQTVGNLAAMMLDRLFMKHGHKALILAGGATSLIGDPGGKDIERPLQSEETVAHNVARAEDQLKKVFVGYDYTMVNNLDWTKDLKVIEFLRDIGKHFSITPLVQRDYINKRLGEGGAGMSYAEFSYTILQGMDYLHLFDQYNCSLQLGGSDQWGNCLSGVELIRKARGNVAHVITLPLIINKATGKKFGKSEYGAIWLDPDKTSIYKFYQFWLNVDDDGVGGYLKIFTELNKDTITQLMIEFENDRASRAAQKRLAYEVTKLVHGQEQANKQVHFAEALVKQDPGSLSVEELSALSQEMPHAEQPAGSGLVNILTSTGIAASNSEARQLLGSNAIYINGQPTAKQQLEVSDFRNGHAFIRRGKSLQNTVIIKVL